MATDHHNKRNNEKVWNSVRITEMGHRHMYKQLLWGKTMPKELLGAGLPQNIIWFKKKKKGKKEKEREKKKKYSIYKA